MDSIRSDVKYVRLTMTASGREAEIHPIYDLFANASCTDRAKALHWNVSGENIGIMHYVYGDIETFRTALTSLPNVPDFELTIVDDDSFYAYLVCVTTETARRMFDTLTRGSLVMVPPIEYASDGTVTVAIVGSSEEIQRAIEGVPAPISVEIREIGGIESVAVAGTGLLSNQQRRATESALALGYYEIPREASVEDVAETIGCARSTAAEHLRKAETKLLRSVLRRGTVP